MFVKNMFVTNTFVYAGAREKARTPKGACRGDSHSARRRPMVEMGGIEPPSIAVSLRLLRAQLVKAFCSAPTFATSI